MADVVRLVNCLEICDVQTDTSCNPDKAASIPANKPAVLPTVATEAAS